LDHQARELIICELARDRAVSFSQIGAKVGCHRSTIQREVAGNGGRHGYSALEAHQKARERATRSWSRLGERKALAAEVRRLLVAGYSPYAVAARTDVCTETIYQAVYSGILGLDPKDVLRTRRPKRRHRRDRQPTSDGNYLGDFTPISDRPKEIDKRDEIGHFEGDLVTGSKNQSAIVTLIERVSRFQCALELPNGHGTKATIAALSRWIETHLFEIKSLTWDRGAELTNWTDLQDQHNINVYFCDPKSPWQRASNENGNRQLRFWFRRGSDLSIWTQKDIDRVCNILNTTPRRIHNGATAHNIYHNQPRTRE
jgi:IS30 family transposase